MSRAGQVYLCGMQIDQDPGDYRVQASDGSWQTRLNRPMARWMAVMASGLFAWFTASFVQSGGDLLPPILFGAIGFLIGGLVVLSMKSLNW